MGLKQSIGYLGGAGLVALALVAWDPFVYDPREGIWAVLGCLAVFPLMFGVGSALGVSRLSLPLPVWLGLGFFAYMALSLLWAVDPQHGLTQIAKVGTILVLFLALYFLPRQHLRIIAPLGISAALVAAIVMGSVFWPASNEAGGFYNVNFQAEFMVMALPFLLYFVLRPSRWEWIVASLAAIPVLLFIFLQAGGNLRWLALLAVAGVLVAWQVRRRYYWGACMSVLAPLAAALSLGLVTAESIWSSMAARAEVFTNSIHTWLDYPIFGTGIGGFAYAYALNQEAHKALFPDIDTLLHPMAQFVNSAHNEILQTLVQFGLVGLILAGLLIWVFVGEVRRKALDHLDLAAIGTLGLCAVLSLVGFPLHNPATALLTALSVAILCQGLDACWIRVIRLPFAVAGVAAMFGLAVNSGFSYVGHIFYTNVRPYIKAGKPLPALIMNVRAVQWYPLQRQFRHQISMTLGALHSAGGNRVRITPEAADLAYSLSLSAAPHTPAVKMSRIVYLMRSNRVEEKRPEAEQLLEDMRTRAALQGWTWIAEANMAAQNQDIKRFVGAVNAGRQVKPEDAFQSLELEKLADMLKEYKQ